MKPDLETRLERALAAGDRLDSVSTKVLLADAMKARRTARAMRTGDPMRYAAWRRVTYCESLLSDDDFAAYRRWADDTDKAVL